MKKNTSTKKRKITLKKSKQFKNVLILLFILLLSILIITIILSINNDYIKLKNINIELGNELSTDINDYIMTTNIPNKKIKNINLDLSDVLIKDDKVIKIGTYKYFVTYKNKEYEGTIKVEDTTKPILKLNNVIITKGEELKIDDFIEECIDINGCSYEYEDENFVSSKLNEVGIHEIKIIAKDKSNNNIINKTTLEILEQPINKTVYTYPYPNNGKGKGIPVLNYHFTINKEEKKDCSPASICMDENLFEEHLKYITENGFYTPKLEELEKYLDGEINLPEKSVVITIDDGWFVGRAIALLNKYKVNATLFLIGSLASPNDYFSDYLEIHSHGWNLHNLNGCNIGRGGGILCLEKKELLEDLKKSRESLNNSKYFCYPFYEYNEYAINALKQAGFTMAFTGGNSRAKVGVDKYKVPRYVIYSDTTVEKLEKIIN